MNLEIEALKQTVVGLSLEVTQKQIESLESKLKEDKQNEINE